MVGGGGGGKSSRTAGRNQWRIQTRGVGGHPDPEIRGKPGFKKFFFRPYGPQFGLKLRGKGDGSPGLLPWICHWKHEVAQNTYIPTPMPFSCIFLLNTVSILPCVNEYSNINASKMNATNILKIKEKEFFFKLITVKIVSLNYF